MRRYKKLGVRSTIVIFLVAVMGNLAMTKVDYRDTDAILRTMAISNENNKNTIILGYVTSWSKELPNPIYLTHLSYAFATIDNDFNGLSIKNEDRFREIVSLKKTNPNLKVLLSIGGWGAGNFSEMASTKKSRTIFIHEAMNIVRKFDIDGLDIDWEYPGSSMAKITSSRNDRSNFTILIKELRDSLGNKRILSFASPAYGNYFEYKKLIPYVDFVNIMTYDMSTPPHHHSPLNHSSLTGEKTVKDVIFEHYKRGIPVNKMILGIPFYGRGNEKDYKRFEDFRYIYQKAYTDYKFDSIAGVPYIADKKSGEMLISFEDSTSISVKCRFVKETGLKGVMIWHYCGDTKYHNLLKVINAELK